MSEETLEKDTNKTYVEKQKIINDYIFFIDDDIEESKLYRELYKISSGASEEDTIKLVINSYGGYIASTVQIINTLLLSKAKTIAEIHLAQSAATYIALICDDIHVMKFATMMFHVSSYDELNNMKVPDINSLSQSALNDNKIMLSDICLGFLTQEEIDNILIGKEIYFNEKEILKRLKNHISYRKRKFNKK